MGHFAGLDSLRQLPGDAVFQGVTTFLPIKVVDGAEVFNLDYAEKQRLGLLLYPGQ